MSATLLVLAGGFGSRFGGFKQIEPITPSGRVILDFTVYDAVAAGFDKVVFVVGEKFRDQFIATVGARTENLVSDVKYVTQSNEDCPAGRNKPLGTSHAILCCKDVIDQPFAVVNADDYYGKDALVLAYKHLSAFRPFNFGMVSYLVGNTLSPNGVVCRGVCKLQDEHLVDIAETKVSLACDGSVQCQDGVVLPADTPVSMNLWLLGPEVFDVLDKQYKAFLTGADLMTEEFLIPLSVKEMLNSGAATVRAYLCKDKWYGITYRSDLEEARNGLNFLVDIGEYPDF